MRRSAVLLCAGAARQCASQARQTFDEIYAQESLEWEWGQSYRERDFRKGHPGEPLDAVLPELLGEKGGKVLVLGGGLSQLAAGLHEDGFHVTEVEASEVAVNKKRATNPPGLTTLLGDACNLDFADGSFDAVVEKQTFDYLVLFGGVEQAVAEAHRVLRDGGRLLSINGGDAQHRAFMHSTFARSFSACRWEARVGSKKFHERTQLQWCLKAAHEDL